MAKNDIGGFFVSLGLNPDKHSFETGNKLIDGVATGLNKIIGTARNAAVVLAATATATGVVESANYKLSDAMGTSIENLDLWRAAAKIAGTNADGLLGSMGKLADVLNHQTIDGSGIEAYSDQLWKLRMNWQDIEKMDPAEAFEKIIATAQERAAEAQKKITEAQKTLEINPNDAEAQKKLEVAKTEKQTVTVAVGDILGKEGQGFFSELQRQGMSIEAFLDKAQSTIFTNAESNQKGADFAVEFNTLKTTMESMGKLVGDEVAGLLTEPLKEINTWLTTNGTEIKSKISAISKIAFDKVVDGMDYVHKWWEQHGDETVRIISSIKSTAESIIGTSVQALSEWWDQHGDTAVATIESINKYVSLIVAKTFDAMSKSEVKAVGGIMADTWKTAAMSPINMIVKPIQATKEGGFKAGAKSAWDEYYNAADKILIDPWRRLGEVIGQKWAEERDWTFGPNFGKKKSELQDGILRPDGTVTKVAPDDWVFAVRNIADMAEAFTPEQPTPQSTPQTPVVQHPQKEPAKKIAEPKTPIINIAEPENGKPIINIPEQKTESPIVQITEPEPARMVVQNNGLENMEQMVKQIVSQISHAVMKQQTPTNNRQEYTISQTFNIQGGTNDIPAVIRQQAYNGTQNALLQAMEQCSRRMQMMSGTR